MAPQDDSDERQTNREAWDAWTSINFASEFYDVEGFVQGAARRRSAMDALEAELLGDVSGQSLLHLQCHFGMDTLTQARRGAQVTGVDFSSEAIGRARALARRIGQRDARFVESDIYRLPEVLDGHFDVVFTSLGVLGWLDDLPRWAEIVAHFLRPGGRFVILEGHPLAWIFDDERTDPDLRVAYSYFEAAEALLIEQDRVYSDPETPVETRTFEWSHSLREILGSLLRAGLTIEHFDEYPFAAWKMFPWMTPRDDGTWTLPDDHPSLPLLFSLRARKPPR